MMSDALSVYDEDGQRIADPHNVVPRAPLPRGHHLTTTFEVSAGITRTLAVDPEHSDYIAWSRWRWSGAGIREGPPLNLTAAEREAYQQHRAALLRGPSLSWRAAA